LYERALAIIEKVLGADHPDTARSLNNLAVLLKDQAEYATARPLYERALTIYENVLGREHVSTNIVRCNLARVLLITGSATEALDVAQIALSAHDKALGKHHNYTKGSAKVTADALDALGRMEEAKALREWYGVAVSEKPNSA